MKTVHPSLRRATLFALLVLGFIAFNAGRARAQSVAGGTVISNRVAVTYTEPAGATVNTFSNTVTVTVTNVTGLVITPDAGTAPAVHGGATGVTRTFVISDTGNINESVTFGAGGASLITSGPITVTGAYVDVDNSGTLTAGDINILTNTGPLALNFGTSVNVIVTMDVSPTATVGQTISLQLGTANTNAPSHDNVPAAGAAAGAVKTVGSTGVNGDLQARGDMTFTVDSVGAVFVGPLGQPLAVGPTSNNDDYTNRTQTAGVSVPFGGTTTAGGVLIFQNTLLNQANIADNIQVAPTTTPAGFTVEVSADGTTYAGSITVNVASGATKNIFVRVTAPSGISVLTGFGSVIRATSSITPQDFNETIDRLWSGFIRVDKVVTVSNSTGVGGPTDAVPGSVLQYQLNYSNVTATSGTGNADLTASNVTFTEDGSSAPNNWASTTTQVVGSVVDSNGGAITGDVAGSSLITVTVPTLGPGQSGNFKFSRKIK
jgi:hypothetical protein